MSDLTETLPSKLYILQELDLYKTALERHI